MNSCPLWDIAPALEYLWAKVKRYPKTFVAFATLEIGFNARHI